MEILNNIWSALTSENAALAEIITFPFYFVEMYLSIFIVSVVLKVDFTKKQKFIYVISLPLLSLLVKPFVNEPIFVIINYGILFLLLFKFYKLSFVKSVLAIVIPFAIFAIVNTLIMKPFLQIFNITLEVTSNIPIYYFTYLCTVYLIVGLIIFLIKHKNFYLKLRVDNDKVINKIIVENLILGIITLFMQAILTYYYINIVPIVITVINLILLLAYFILSFYSLSKATKLHETTRELETAESYNKSLTILYDNVKGFKHDFDNMVNTIGGYIVVDDMDGLKKYYSNLKKDTVRVKNIGLLNPNIINNPGIYNLLVAEYQKATDQNVIINFEFFFDFNNLHMPIYEFSRILGILLDNAIDAAKECDNKEINLVFRESTKNSVQIITIENTYIDKDIDTTKIFDKGVSGKENHSGIGLWEVKQIEKKYNNIVLHTSKDEKYFKQQLEIYY